MTQAENSPSPAMLPVRRSKREAQHLYDRISKLYDFIAGTFEHKYARIALEYLAIQNGENVLEIGFGSGYCLEQIAQSVDKTGKVYGIDISPGMLAVTKQRLEKARLMDRVELHLGDAANLPYDDNTFDAAFMSFTLELFDTPEIPTVLKEVKRVLKSDGRLGAVSMSRSYGESTALRIYEWAHKKWGKYIDCRPIYAERCLIDAGYKIERKEKARLMGLPLESIIATKAINNS